MTNIIFFHLQKANPSITDMVVKFGHPVLLGEGLRPLLITTLAGCLKPQVQSRPQMVEITSNFYFYNPKFYTLALAETTYMAMRNRFLHRKKINKNIIANTHLY